MRRSALGMMVGLAVAACAVVVTAQGQLPGVEPLHDSGQDVTPSFEGWYENADGTFTMSFGYMNRNLKEEVDIPVGPDNRIEPNGPDRGQPTHFYARRQMGVFGIVVPKDFGTRRLTWTLVRNGKTSSTTGHLDRRWLIDALADTTINNKPPSIRFQQSGTPHMGPLPISMSLKTRVNTPVTLDVWTTDDGVTLRPSNQAPVLTVTWSKFRSPGEVKFADATPDVDRASGHATTTATFSTPGEYWLRLSANDYTGPTGASGQCCWTNGLAKISVQ